MKKYLLGKIIAIIVITLGLAFYVLPPNIQKSIVPFTPETLLNTKMQLGLDLQGGSQLDYKIDLRSVPEADREGIVDGVLKVIEKRVNGLGVAEPNIYTSAAGDETHIIVELAETGVITQSDIDLYLGTGKALKDLTDDEKKIVSLEKAKATVGKTIQLEFKEEKDTVDPLEIDKIKSQAEETLTRIKDGADFAVTGQEEQQAYPGKVSYEEVDYTFESDLSAKLEEILPALKIGAVAKSLVETGGSFQIDQNGQAVENTGLSIVKLIDVREEKKDDKSVEVSHILISYKGADGANDSVTRTEDEAYKLAKEIKAKIADGEDFATLAQTYSDDSSNKDQGGRLDKAVTGDGTYVYDFEKAALALEKDGQVSDIVKTQFGYHLIKANKIETDIKENQYKYQIITYSTVPDPWKDTGLTGEQFVHADVQLNNFYQPYVTIQFNDEGAKLFEEITGRNVGKKVAIFVGGNLISAPVVNEKISGGSAQISGQFTNEEAKALAQDLNTGAIPAPIVLAGEYTIGATLGHDALVNSIWAGIIGFLLVVLFMIFNYRLSGVVATFALFSYVAVLLFLLKAQIHLGFALAISLAVFVFMIIKTINNKDSGWEKLLSFVLSCAAFFFLTYLLKTGIVVTLAGIAGFIMSIGMAVDANVLIFERFKEELREGKTYAAALESGFDRAWSAIRDSNFTTLLICAVLFTFGSATIKGFAFTLAAGVVVSMFSAITVTRTFMQGFVNKKISQNIKAFGVKERKAFSLPFIKNSKTWLSVSGTVFVLAILTMLIFGLNLGFDFTGGTLMEFKFKKPVTKEQLATNLAEIGQKLNKELASEAVAPSSAPEVSTEDTKSLQGTSADEEIDLTSAKIIVSGENSYIVKTRYISSATHEKIVAEMKNALPEFTEPRFTTIGAVIGKSTLLGALKAVIISLLIIIAYVAFAFRKVPKEVSPWRFGAAAIVALIHDVTIVAGLFVGLGLLLNVEIDALFITAMLTVFGYSVNDTIIIFDKIRENLISAHKDEDFSTIANRALNETLTRSINTTMTTILALIAVLIFGSSSIFFFILALTVGIFLGAYSSIFVASPVLVLWNNYAQKKKQGLS